MGVLGAVARSAQTYPALLPICLAAVAVALWAYQRRKWMLLTAALLAGGISGLLYTGGIQAQAMPRLPGSGDSGMVVAGRPFRAGIGSARGEGGHFSSTARLHPRFPEDFPVPSVLRLESNSGGLRSGTVTVRFRFRGEGADAVRDLRDMGRANGWDVEVKAPHRLVFRKGGRIVEAWFSFPGHSVVLDILDPR